MTNIAFQHKCIVLDADCTINLDASGHMEDVMANVPCGFAVTEYVHSQEVLRCDIQPFIDSGVLKLISLKPAEQMTMIDLAARGLDDGESSSGAVAIHRNWAIGIDDKAARRYLGQNHPHIQLISVVDLIKHWADVTCLSDERIRSTLFNIGTKGNYRPGPRHPLYTWWKRHQ